MADRAMNDPRLRQALIAVAGISTLGTIYLIHKRYTKSSTSSDPPSPLRRRNAVRRPDTSRRTRAQTQGTGADSLEVSEQAIATLRIRQEIDDSYGEMICNVRQLPGHEDGIQPRQTERRWPLLPTRLPTVQSLESREEDYGASSHEEIRQSAETLFMTAFLSSHFPIGHLIGPREARYLEDQLGTMGLTSSTVMQSIEVFNETPDAGRVVEPRSGNVPTPTFVDGVVDQQRTRALTQTREGQRTTDEQSQFDWRDGDADQDLDLDHARRGQTLLNLLFNIASDQAKRNGHVHRGIECNSCGTQPIQGIRYRCANCVDYDLCESCEAQQPHTKTHVFFKIRIPFNPIGPLGNSRSALPVWYPGNPGSLPASLPHELFSRLLQETGYDNAELDALWEQFRCLAAARWTKDPTELGMAIDRPTFDKCFVPPLKIRSQPSNLIYDRLFAFYDTDGDGMIGFERFVKGLASLGDKSRDGRLKRIFQGYDLDHDGFISRRDFLRIFRAFYALSKELNQEIMASMEDDLVERGARELVRGNHPISAAFGGDFPLGHTASQPDGKTRDANGDMVMEASQAVVQDGPYDLSDRNTVIAAAAGLDPTRPLGQPPIPPELMPPLLPGGSENDEEFHPPLVDVQAQDIVEALGDDVALSEIMDPLDQVRVASAQVTRRVTEAAAEQEQARENVYDRWRRRGFYTDVEEGGTVPHGYVELTSSDEDFTVPEDWPESETSVSISRPITPRSRSSSKVRFDDSVNEADYETRSNTSSRSIPLGERWGGDGNSKCEKAVAQEILYQEIQQGFNDLLNQLFKEKEDLAMDAIRTKDVRYRYAAEISAYSKAFDSETIKKRPGWDVETWTKRGKDLDKEVRGILKDAGFLTGPSRAEREQRMKPSSQFSKRKNYQDVIIAKERHVVISASPTQNSNSRTEVIDPDEQESQDRDPTLPQFRPNSGDHKPVGLHFRSGSEEASRSLDESEFSKHAHKPAALNLDSHDESIPILDSDGTSNLLAFPTSTPRIPASRSFIDKYAAYSKVDQEAKKRRGYGKLDFDEFSRAMVWGKKAASADDEGVSKDEAGTGRRKWNRKEGLLGNLGFVISWIELLSF